MEAAGLLLILALGVAFFGALRLAAAAGRGERVRSIVAVVGASAAAVSVAAFLLLGPAGRAGVWRALGLSVHGAALIIALVFVVGMSMLVSLGLHWLHGKCRVARLT